MLLPNSAHTGQATLSISGQVASFINSSLTQS
jgi:hypothetical protein